MSLLSFLVDSNDQSINRSIRWMQFNVQQKKLQILKNETLKSSSSQTQTQADYVYVGQMLQMEIDKKKLFYTKKKKKK